MATYASYAVSRGVALIAIDPPGWGESGLSGCLFSTIEDYRECTHQLYDHILTEKLLDDTRLATFGGSGGSLTAVIVAGLAGFVTAVAGIGAPEYKNLAPVWKMRSQNRDTKRRRGRA